MQNSKTINYKKIGKTVTVKKKFHNGKPFPKKQSILLKGDKTNEKDASISAKKMSCNIKGFTFKINIGF
ncbi:MAG: hypothetical protein JO072_12165 [Parafilimonas sp.]|nr:hypothetical protein [Parafilimonas sp.]